MKKKESPVERARRRAIERAPQVSPKTAAWIEVLMTALGHNNTIAMRADYLTLRCGREVKHFDALMVSEADKLIKELREERGY